MNIGAAHSASPPGVPARAGFIAYFAANPVAANVLMLFLIVGGLAAGSRLVVQHYPDLDLRTVRVTVEAPGASPQRSRGGNHSSHRSKCCRARRSRPRGGYGKRGSGSGFR